MSDLRVGIVGVSGRMGQEILAVINEQKVTRAVLGVDRNKGAQVDRLVSEPSGISAGEIDVLIDFSSPDLLPKVIEASRRAKIPLVCGTTGLQPEHHELLRLAATEVPVLWAPNMSLGVALMASMFKVFSGVDGFDFQIEELHHNRKKDAPSGTALYLQQKLAGSTGKQLPEALAIRGGGIFGIHRAWAMAEEEMLTIEHTAMNRRVFARGAVKAAQWVALQTPGLYAMTDVLGLQV